jgi:hypothetical protein
VEHSSLRQADVLGNVLLARSMRVGGLLLYFSPCRGGRRDGGLGGGLVPGEDLRAHPEDAEEQSRAGDDAED